MKHFARFVVPLLFLSAATASAATFRHEERLSISVPFRDDVYAAGGSVDVDAPVTGDLFAAGGQVTVSAPIHGDLFVGAGNVNVDAKVDDDARIGGGTVIINAEIGDDLLVTGGQIMINKDTRVRGDLVVTGGDVTVHGTVEGNVLVYAGRVLLQGPIGGNLEAKGGQIDFSAKVAGSALIVGDRILPGAGSSVGKDLTYWSQNQDVTFPSVRGKTTFDETLRHEPRHDGAGLKAVVAIAGAWLLYSILSGMAVILLFVLVTKKFFVEAAAYLRKSPGLSFLWGLLYMMLLPILGLLLFVTVIGIPLGIMTFAMFGLTVLFSGPITAVTFAKWLQGNKRWNTFTVFAVSVGLLLVLKVLMFVPVLGWILKSVAVLFAIGAVLSVKWNNAKKML